MTANELFDTSVTLMFGTTEDKAEYQPLFLNILNLLLAENYELNNALRAARGKVRLEEIPSIETMFEDIPYEDVIVQSILPFGCAGYIYTDDDKSVGADYKNKYEAERNRLLCADYTEI